MTYNHTAPDVDAYNFRRTLRNAAIGSLTALTLCAGSIGLSRTVDPESLLRSEAGTKLLGANVIGPAVKMVYEGVQSIDNALERIDDVPAAAGIAFLTLLGGYMGMQRSRPKTLEQIEQEARDRLVADQMRRWKPTYR